MMQKRALLLALTALFPGASHATLSDLRCDDTTRMTEQLSSVTGAYKQSRGLRAPDAILEVWIAPRSGEWTLVQSYSNGTSCIVAMGHAWEELQSDADPA